MQNYHDLLAQIMQEGYDIKNERTGKVCRTLVGAQLKFDLREGFPAITNKKLAFAGVKGELLGFFRGYTSAADFRALGCKVWDQNANETAAWLANPNRKGVDDLGPVYGAQWTGWHAYREIDQARQNIVAHAQDLGFELIAQNPDTLVGIYRRRINQLEQALHTLLTNPTDRRIIVSGWNVGELDRMALPPCHMDYRFVSVPDRDGGTPRLHVVMTIRSWDTFLGGPFNIASTALFLVIMARLSGHIAATVTIQATNAHIYEDHFEQVSEQLGRQHLKAPRLWLAEHVRKVGVNEIAGAFARIQPADIELVDYESHAAIKAPMAA